MQPQEERLLNGIALGWVMQLLVVVIMFVFMTIDSILMDDSFRSLRVDPGRKGLDMMAYIFGLYALMPIYVHLVHGMRLRLYRWIAVLMAVLGFIYFLLHHLAHWAAMQRPDFNSHVLDLVLHLIGLWVIVNSVKWASFRSRQRHEWRGEEHHES